MEQYRVKLKLQNLAIAICCFILSAFSFLSAAAEAGHIPFMNPISGDSHYQSMWRGFACGAATGFLIFLIALLVRNILALRDDDKLKKLYVKENDERQIQVWTSARATAMQIFLLGGIVAGIIAGYFSIVVSVTIVVCVFILSIIGLICKIYYDIKF